MKQKLCMILALLMMAGTLGSCAGNDKTNETVKTGNEPDIQQKDQSGGENDTEPDEEELNAPEIVNMEGKSLTILNSKPENFNWANTLVCVDETNGEVLNDALYNRERRVEELYNCSIGEQAEADVSGTFSTSVFAGDTPFDTALLFDAQVSNMLTNGYLMSWNELGGLDLTNEWWDRAATEQYNFCGIQAAVSGAFSLYNYSTRHCYVFNGDMLADVATGTNLYDTVREGKWTVDELYRLGELAVSDLDGNGAYEADNDRFGITSSVTRHYSAMLAGSGVKYIDRNEDGDLYFNINGNENAQAVISKLVQLNVGNTIFTSGHDDIGSGAESPIFYNGRALFIAAYVGEAARMRDVDFNIGIVPPPKYTEAQDSYYSLVEGGAMSILPKNLKAEDRDKVSVILDAFGYYSYIESIPAYIDRVLMSKTARDEDSAEMLELVFDTSFYDLGTGVWSGDTKNMFTSKVFLPKNEEIASLIKTTEKIISRNLSKFTEAVVALDSNGQLS